MPIIRNTTARILTLNFGYTQDKVRGLTNRKIQFTPGETEITTQQLKEARKIKVFKQWEDGAEASRVVPKKVVDPNTKQEIYVPTREKYKKDPYLVVVNTTKKKDDPSE